MHVSPDWYPLEMGPPSESVPRHVPHLRSIRNGEAHGVRDPLT